VGPAAPEDELSSAARVAWLGIALAGWADELAAACREIVSVRREHGALKSVFDRGSAA